MRDYTHLRLAVLGSTGSIGTQALDVARRLGIRVAALAADTNASAVEDQARAFLPEYAVMGNESAAAELKQRLADTSVKVLAGEGALCSVASLEDTVTLNAVSGIAGQRACEAAARAGNKIALANKESLVCAGELVTKAARESGAELIPVDSEHSAIYQCLLALPEGNRPERLILTASGGPFRNYTIEQMAAVTPEAALRHPNWSMGKKISIDSATMMNKGLELIEAMWLFGMPEDSIDILVHPESVVHSMVALGDGAVLAQLGAPDMRVPIQFALTCPRHEESGFERLDLLKYGSLTFEKPDEERFGLLKTARECARAGGAACAAMNGANEEAVSLFLRGAVGFADIESLVALALDSCSSGEIRTLDDVFEYDRAARETVRSAARKIRGRG